MKPFVYTIDSSLTKKLQQDLKNKGFTFQEKEHALFSAKSNGISLTLYKSLKLVVQGKKSSEFVEFYLEPEILKSFSHTHPTSGYIAHIGVDESGKGDFFGPLCVASVYADKSHVELLHKRGIGESKTTTDKKAREDALFIAKHMPYHLIRLSPQKYNQLYSQYKNLNTLLGACHAEAINEMYKKTDCKQVTIDQFASERVVLDALKKKNTQVELTQRHRGEEDIVVAAASLIARAAFLKGLTILQDHYKMVFPKGASKKVIAAGRQFVGKYGKQALNEAAKLHLKTTNEVV